MWIVYPRTFPITVVTGCAEVQQRLLISQPPRNVTLRDVWHLGIGFGISLVDLPPRSV
jgi:hypothetical protein